MGRCARNSGRYTASGGAPSPAADRRTIDQISQAVQLLKTNPDSRRILVSAWNVGELEQMALMPCHAFFQLYVAAGRLSCQLYQRSADMFLGVPFNIASYALLTHLFAQQCDLEAGEFIWTGGDCHLYLNHLEQADLQLARSPLPLPQLRILRKPASIFDYQYEDFEFVNYQQHAAIRAPVAVGAPPRASARRPSRSAIRRCTASVYSPPGASRRVRGFCSIWGSVYRTSRRTAATMTSTRTTITRSCSSSMSAP